MRAVPHVDVAACIVRAEDGRVLLAQRREGQLSPGYWELPGGKIDPGETPERAAARELREEVGLEALALKPWVSYEHAFPARRIRLRFFVVERWAGTAHGREGQRIAWTDPKEPGVMPILPSNHRVLFGLGLPARCAIVEPGELEPALAAGTRLIALRVSAASPDQRVSIVRRALERVRGRATVLLTGSALEARRAGAGGVHSETRELRRLSERPNVRIWSASCEAPSDLERAHALGADFAIVRGDLDLGAARLPVCRANGGALAFDTIEGMPKSA